MGESASVGMDEAQARLWENRVGRSPGFWRYFYPRCRELFPDALRGYGLDDLFFAVNQVKPSLIRVNADEVTYNLHVLVRFELERALMSGDLKSGRRARGLECGLSPVSRGRAGQ